MALLRRQKLTIILLVFYWPTLFILAHIPIPQLVQEIGVSDKSLHFLAYLILVFLLWSAISPYRKVNWRKATVWWVLFAVVWYGVCDEWLQGYVALRTTDATDFFADLVGAVTGLIVLSVFAFWPASLMVTGVTIFGLTNITRVNIADLLPVINTAFHLFAYAFFTMLWIQYLYHCLSLKTLKSKWLIVAPSLPIGFLLAVKLGSLILGRSFTITDVIVSAVGIIAVVVTTSLIALFRKKTCQNSRSVSC